MSRSEAKKLAGLADKLARDAIRLSDQIANLVAEMGEKK